MKKKINYNEKRKKKICAEIGMGYCPIVLQKEMKLYCNTTIVLQGRRLEGWKFYCNTADCIAKSVVWLGEKLYCKTKFVLQQRRKPGWETAVCHNTIFVS